MSRLLCKYEDELFIQRLGIATDAKFKYWYNRTNGKIINIVVQYVGEATEWEFELNHEGEWCLKTDADELLVVNQPRYKSFNQLVLGIIWQLNSPAIIDEDHSLLSLEDFDKGEMIHEF